ncbi:hypothetical protein [Streptomyces sp. NPDC001889]
MSEGPVVVGDAGGSRVIAARERGSAVAAATLAVPLTDDRPAAVAAPLLAACWAREVARAARRAGAAVRADPVTTPDWAGVTVESLRADHPCLRSLPEWFAGAARVPESGYEEVRAACLARLAAEDQRSDGVRRALFGPAHRYGIGHAERVRALAGCGPDEAAVLSGRVLGAAPPVLALSHADPADLPGLLTALSTGRRPVARPAPGPARVAGPVTVSVPAGTGLVHQLRATPGVGLGSPDKAAVHLAWALLGGRDGLLDRELRGERALTYSLAAFSREFAAGGYGLTVATCAEGAREEVAARTVAVIGGLGRGEFAGGLLAAARERLMVRYLGAEHRARGCTERLCGYAVAGLDPEESARYPSALLRVTRREVCGVVRHYLRPTADGEAPTPATT